MDFMGFFNLTPFRGEHYFLADERGSDVLTVVVKATYEIVDTERIEVAAEQDGIVEAAEYYGEPGESSIKYDSEICFTKPKADVVLIGHAQIPGAEQPELDVHFRVGAVQKTVRVFGDRLWRKSLLGWSSSKPAPFEKMPLCYERSYGGSDKSHPEEEHHDYEPRNPLGAGFVAKKSELEIRELALPNLEDSGQLLKKPKQKPSPAGFGFIGPEWESRKELAGAFDEAWRKDKFPLLPDNFDAAFFNAASPDLIAPQHFVGGEQVEVVHASALGNLSFRLPSVEPETIVMMKDGTRRSLDMKLDTVIVNTDDNKVHLIWRTHMLVYKQMRQILWVKTQLKTEGEKVCR